VGFPFGLSVGVYTSSQTRFIPALAFCRRRRDHQVKGTGRMFLIRFSRPRNPMPFAIGHSSHFGLGLFVPAIDAAHPTTSNQNHP